MLIFSPGPELAPEMKETAGNKLFCDFIAREFDDCIVKEVTHQEE